MATTMKMHGFRLASLFLVVWVLLFETVHGQTLDCSSVTVERRSWRMLDCNERQYFLSAIQQLKTLDVNNVLYDANNGLGIPTYDDFVQVHVTNNNIAHGTNAFLPWHRYYLYKFEQALQIVVNDCSMYVPYWDWEIDTASIENGGNGPSQSIVFRSNTFGSTAGLVPVDTIDEQTGEPLDVGCVNEGIASYLNNWSTATGGCLLRYVPRCDSFCFGWEPIFGLLSII